LYYTIVDVDGRQAQTAATKYYTTGETTTFNFNVQNFRQT